MKAFPEAPQAIHEASDLVRMRLSIEDGGVKEWYLGERVTRQSTDLLITMSPVLGNGTKNLTRFRMCALVLHPSVGDCVSNI